MADSLPHRRAKRAKKSSLRSPTSRRISHVICWNSPSAHLFRPASTCAPRDRYRRRSGRDGQRPAQIERVHIGAALNVGVTREEIVEYPDADGGLCRLPRPRSTACSRRRRCSRKRNDGSDTNAPAPWVMSACMIPLCIRAGSPRVPFAIAFALPLGEVPAMKLSSGRSMRFASHALEGKSRPRVVPLEGVDRRRTDGEDRGRENNLSENGRFS